MAPYTCHLGFFDKNAQDFFAQGKHFNLPLFIEGD